MIQLKNYQEDAVKGLLKDTFSALQLQGRRNRMVFKAPTGAGKTVVMAEYLNQLAAEIPDNLNLPKRKVAFIWFAPNQLHLQSYDSLKNYFKELRTLKPIQFEDITNNKLQPNEVLFLNWQSVNSAKNIFVRENEQGKDLLKYVYRAMLDDTEIICILDEAHYQAKGKKAKELLQQISAKIELDVSATPIFKSDYGYTIKRQEVVNAEMIKKNVILNPSLDHHKQDGKTLNHVLLDEALKKQQELKKAYEQLGININPLLLIQLPSDLNKETVLDRKLIDEIETYLKSKNITTQNNKLAVWLSKRKDNLDGLEEKTCMTEVLLFKQAIALGWDCPRAGVLLIFREIQQDSFGIQTVGRILRMPEQKHYTLPILNNGYVYTDLSKDIIKIVQEDIDYIVQNTAKRIDDYQVLNLHSAFINTRLTRNRLSSKFRKCMYEAAEEYFGLSRDLGTISTEEHNTQKLQEKFIALDVSQIEIPIPKNVELATEIGFTEVTEKEKFAKTQSELNILFRQFCRDNVGGYAKADSTPVLELGLKMLFEDYLGLNEFKAIKIILFEQNKSKFIELIDQSLTKHQILLDQKAALASKLVEHNDWNVPVERIYNEYYLQKESKKHALQPFYELNKASNPEREFVLFLENNKEHLDWWYKNGDKNKEDFAITYVDRNEITRGFYVDFVIKTKSGKIALFDTKTLNSDPEFVKKHNALIKYINEKSTTKKPLIGGVIVPKGLLDNRIWKYCDNTISNANDTTGWLSFEPSLI
ncbi:DEAD/DEAH box helicase [Tenacibaculum finnmarkense]|uniref:DEAD/DEAH box helicase n=1 Tax=Tenacibaculum finnmarkense TaxID=2781243 RepID=UPI00187B4DA2|nr:DEAD/DEAH box helicase family protein [Tenacibaculum finnmarkense]MBE7691424.1 DEAD/DEAH box helicase family protein [Tenacibaculum finnmarkense genomovar finnmarkense]